ncbi:MAG: CoA transferase [Acidimicrobiales bacterium]
MIDASDRVAGQFAGRLLADYGAEVVLAEPPGGSVIRSEYPLDSKTGSFLFAHLNSGKSSTVIDRETSDGRRDFLELCGSADVVIVGDDRAASEVIGECPDVICAAVTDFGTSGAYAGWLGTELIHQALSGSMFYTGLEGREPLYGAGRRASYAAGVQIYIGVVAALHGRLSGGAAPRRIDVTIHEAAAAMEQNFSTQYSYNGTYPLRGEQARPRGRARCLDGSIVYFVRFNQWPEFCRAFEAPELIDDPRFAHWTDMVQNWGEAAGELAARAETLTVAHLTAAADRDKLVLAPTMTLEGLGAEEHLRVREFWQEVDGGDHSPGVALGPVFRTSATPCIRNRPAPRLGEIDATDRATRRDERVVDRPARSDERRGPLEGVRVVDFSSAWAGPMTTRILAALGADVVKIEGPARLDAWRGEPFNPPTTAIFPDLDPGERPYNRHAWFNSQNHDKNSVVLDLKDPEGLRTVRRLIQTSDVVVANWSPGALDRAGIGYEELSRVDPRVIVVEMPAISASGPLANQRGLGPTMEAMSGITSLIGYGDGPPLGSGSAYLDPTGGVHGAAAVVTALVHRDLTGHGQHVEVPQREAAMHWIGELLLDTLISGATHRACANTSPIAAPHGAYPALGHDEWIAVAVETDEQWKALVDSFDAESLRDPRFDRADGRLASREELDGLVATVTRIADKHILARQLQDAGVPAAPVNNGRDLFQDRHLRERGWFTRLDHDDVGRREYPGLPLVLDGRRVAPRRSSPMFGQDTDAVLRRVLGLTDDEIDALHATGATATAPRRNS